MPESPRWLLRQGKYERVQAAMKEFGADVSVEDVEYTAGVLREEDQRQEQTKSRNWTRGVWRALIVVCVFFIFQQITGINVPLYYGPHLLGPLFQGSNSLVDKTIAGVEVTAHAHGGQRGRHLLRVPLHRQAGPSQAGHGRLHRHGRVRAVRRGRAGILHGHRRGSWS